MNALTQLWSDRNRYEWFKWRWRIMSVGTGGNIEEKNDGTTKKDDCFCDIIIEFNRTHRAANARKLPDNRKNLLIAELFPFVKLRSLTSVRSAWSPLAGHPAKLFGNERINMERNFHSHISSGKQGERKLPASGRFATLLYLRRFLSLGLKRGILGRIWRNHNELLIAKTSPNNLMPRL